MSLQLQPKKIFESYLPSCECMRLTRERRSRFRYADLTATASWTYLKPRFMCFKFFRSFTPVLRQRIRGRGYQIDFAHQPATRREYLPLNRASSCTRENKIDQFIART